MISDCLNTAHQAIASQIAEMQSHPDPDGQSEPPDWIRRAIDLFELPAIEFAGCVHDSLKHFETAKETADATSISSWWQRVDLILELVLLEPYPRVLIMLISGIKDVAPLAPPQSIHRLARVTRAGIAYGLASEISAADETISTLEQLFADHKVAFSDDDTLADVVEIVEHYLGAGWPRAFEFAAQLERVFR